MAKSKETFNKKEKEKQRIKQRVEKQQKKDARKANAKKGGRLEDMMAFIDENGNLSDTPPDPRNKKSFKLEDIPIGVTKRTKEDEDENRTGVVTYFDESKGYGFINDQQSNERVFVHVNNLLERIKISDKVMFKLGSGPRGLAAIEVKKLS